MGRLYNKKTPTEIGVLFKILFPRHGFYFFIKNISFPSEAEEENKVSPCGKAHKETSRAYDKPENASGEKDPESFNHENAVFRVFFQVG